MNTQSTMLGDRKNEKIKILRAFNLLNLLKLFMNIESHEKHSVEKKKTLRAVFTYETPDFNALC